MSPIIQGQPTAPETPRKEKADSLVILNPSSSGDRMILPPVEFFKIRRESGFVQVDFLTCQYLYVPPESSLCLFFLRLYLLI